jgi:hypothetical protein
MKINLGKKLLLVLTASVSMLTVCDNPSNANNNSAPSSFLKPQVKDTTSQKSQLPDSVTGVYAKSSAHCEAWSYLWEISSEIMEEGNVAYPSYANVNTITLRDGGYDISADSFGMEFTVKEGSKSKLLEEDRRYRIVPDPQGNKIKLSVEDLISGRLVQRDLVRCKKL